MIINPNSLAENFRQEIRESICSINKSPKLIGVLATNDEASHTYSQYMKVGCDKVGAIYNEIILPKDKIENQLLELNDDKDVDGVIVYYPIFGGEEDKKLRGLLSPLKDVEGLHDFWLTRLYSNQRYFEISGNKVKALLPCTPLAVVKLLDSVGLFEGDNNPLSGKTVSIFNRSEVVGRPLAHMLTNDGARVYSFDINDVREYSHGVIGELVDYSRKDILLRSDIIITGVPSSNFDKVKAEEISYNCCCLNFSSYENFEEEVKDKASIFIPRVGPVTVAMCLRNLVRMATSFRD